MNLVGREKSAGGGNQAALVLGGVVRCLFYRAAIKDATTTAITATVDAITTTAIGAITNTTWGLLGGTEKNTVLQCCLATKKQELPCYSTRF